MKMKEARDMELQSRKKNRQMYLRWCNSENKSWSL